jgi:hypothetical protein
MAESGMEKLTWFAITCISYGITYGIAQLPGADTYTWVGGAITFFIMGIMIRNVFTEVSFVGAYTASAFFCTILMFPLNQKFAGLMIIILVIAAFIALAIYASENR